MTVKSSRWGSFVDRQLVQLVKEIQEMQNHAAAAAAERAVARAMASKVGESSEKPENSTHHVQEDLTELEHLVDRIADWKDLSLYCGKSISMATTSRGNEMKIFVMAFAEREDGGGIDFMRVSYSKVVEVRPDALLPAGNMKQIGRSLTAVMPFLAPNFSKNEEQDQQWVQLMQRPDIAKFIIALAFKDALEDDGIKMSFSEPRWDVYAR